MAQPAADHAAANAACSIELPTDSVMRELHLPTLLSLSKNAVPAPHSAPELGIAFAKLYNSKVDSHVFEEANIHRIKGWIGNTLKESRCQKRKDQNEAQKDMMLTLIRGIKVQLRENQAAYISRPASNPTPISEETQTSMWVDDSAESALVGQSSVSGTGGNSSSNSPSGWSSDDQGSGFMAEEKEPEGPLDVQEPSVLDICVERMQEEADQWLAFDFYEELNGEKFPGQPEGPLDVHATPVAAGASATAAAARPVGRRARAAAVRDLPGE